MNADRRLRQITLVTGEVADVANNQTPGLTIATVIPAWHRNSRLTQCYTAAHGKRRSFPHLGTFDRRRFPA
jgi:hypothetical protein